MATEVRQIIHDGMVQGRGIRETAKEIEERIDVNRSRAETIARTETVQAYQVATHRETARAEQETGQDIDLRWITARDSQVRHLHAQWHGTTATTEDTARRVSISPWNCRCSQIPFIEGVSRDDSERFNEERRQLLDEEAST
jgi:SPP1 gp7 family putative phage head morphogenesis protein